ncbi:MAG: outer membrane protein insertion porin family [Candidatus Binatota bacterium]|nr:outer membrane protein insertion porin family [Candidatus Binatota bacterium]
MADVLPDTFGRTVEEIRFETPVPIDRGEFLRRLPVRRGAPLRPDDVRESLEWLRAKEVFSAVDVSTIPTAGGVDVEFRLWPVDVVTGVDIDGVERFSVEDVLRRARIREGEILRPADEEKAVARIHDLYRDRGYVDARARIERRAAGPGVTYVTVRVVEGRPIRVRRVVVTTAAGREIVGLAEARLPVKEGDVWTKQSLRSGRDALVTLLRKVGFYEAVVESTQSVRGHRAELRYGARPGERFAVEVRGNRAVTSGELLSLVDLASRPIVTAGTWRELARRMQERYHELGYAFARVRVRVRADETPRRVRFLVREGQQLRVTSIRFEGNHALSDRELRQGLETTGASILPFFGATGAFVDDRFADDLERIREHYRTAGYLQADVIGLRFTLDDDFRALAVTIVVYEGPRSIVRSVRIEGGDALGGELPALRLGPGVPFDFGAFAADRQLLTDRVAARGHPDARVDGQPIPAGAEQGRRRVDVRYDVHPEEYVTIGDISIHGNYFTRDRVIRRELPFHEGDPYDPAAIVGAQSQIFRLGIFRSVDIQPVPAEPGRRDLVARVGERPGGELQYGFGYNTRSGIRSFVQGGHRNLYGTGRQASLRGELNLAPRNLAPDEYITDLGFREPRLLDSRYDGRANLIYQRSERNVDEFSIRRFAFSAGVEREFIPGLDASFLVELDDSRIFDVAPDAVLTGQDVGKLRIVSLNPILVYDGRDDAFAPTRGIFETLRLRYGAPALGSDVHLFKVSAQHSQYVPLGHSLTFLYAARAGIAEPLGSSQTVPLRERFFLGGRTTVRGFEENSIGPRGVDGHPIGGDLLLNANTEIRVPIAWGLAGAAFADGGALYLRDRVLSFGDFRESAGPGLRYQTPIGAVSLDYGFKVDRRPGESPGELHFTIGNVF